MAFFRAAGDTFGWVFARHGHMMIGAIPNRDAMSPPQLTADTPILDILKPVEICLLEPLRNNPNAPIPHGVEGGFRQGFNRHKPLGGDHRLEDFSAALGAGNGGTIRFCPDDEARLL